MKKKNLLVTFGLALAVGLGIGVGLSVNKEAVEVKADVTYYYYHGTDTTTPKVESSWGGSSTYKLVDGGETVAWPFVSGEAFKLTDTQSSWGDEYYATISGSAAALFSGGYADDSNSNIVYNGGSNATFNVTLSSGTIYFDYQNNSTFYYVGSDDTKAGSEWKNYTTKPISLNGDSVTFEFASAEEFKIRPICDNTKWDGVLGTDNLADAYYGIFSGSGNIYVGYGASYDVSLTQTNHVISINIVAHNPTSNTAYVLDMFGSKSPSKAHYFHYDSTSKKTVGTTWTGVDLTSVSGRIYSYTYWDAFDKVIFNANSNTSQTDDLTAEAGKCFVLENTSDWSGRWVSLEAAQFIDENMRFSTIETSDTTSGTDCLGFYSSVKSAYDGLSSNSVRLEALGVANVLDRLLAWAEANGDTLDITSGGKLSASKAPLTSVSQSSSNTTTSIIVVSFVATAVVAGGLFLLRKRKEI